MNEDDKQLIMPALPTCLIGEINGKYLILQENPQGQFHYLDEDGVSHEVIEPETLAFATVFPFPGLDRIEGGMEATDPAHTTEFIPDDVDDDVLLARMVRGMRAYGVWYDRKVTVLDEAMQRGDIG